MNPALDQLLVAALVLGAVAFFVVRFLRKRASGKSCGDCGCKASAPPIGAGTDFRTKKPVSNAAGSGGDGER